MWGIGSRSPDLGTPAKAASISVRGLTKRYGDAIVVKNLSLEVAEGELVVLLGPSGCGKTTTMRCILGLDQPEEGSILIGEREVFNAATGVNVQPNRRGAGMVFQSYAIWPHMTVAQNVAFPLKMQRLPKAQIKDRVEEALELVGLAGFGARPASRLSGGQMQRVALARSVIMRPQVLCLDEPLSNLDAKLRDRLRFEIRQLQQDLKITAIYVTHDQSEALALADRLVVMRAGEIVRMADPVSVYRNPGSTYVADFLGVSNIFDATVTATSPEGASARLDDSALVLHSAMPGQAGQKVSICMRPEAVRVSAAAGDTPNELRGRIAVANFLGTQTRYQVEIEGGPVITVATSAMDDPFRADDEIFVSMPRQAVQLICREIAPAERERPHDD